MKVVGCNEWQFKSFRDLHQIKAELRFNLEPVIHDFAEVVASTKNVAVISSSRERLLILTGL